MLSAEPTQTFSCCFARAGPEIAVAVAKIVTKIAGADTQGRGVSTGATRLCCAELLGLLGFAIQ
jgi:hypothetical protein